MIHRRRMHEDPDRKVFLRSRPARKGPSFVGPRQVIASRVASIGVSLSETNFAVLLIQAFCDSIHFWGLKSL